MNDHTVESAKGLIDKSGIKAGQRYLHYKTGTSYLVIALALLESTIDPVVVYMAPDGATWVRLLSLFNGHVLVNNHLTPRFTLAS